MKYETHSLYSLAGVSLAESCFLTVWSGLGSWHEDLVLLGGLVPSYLCGDTKEKRELPRPVTIDTDFGVGLDPANERYGSLGLDLQAQGFSVSKRQFASPRFVKTLGNVDVFVDFLVEHPNAAQGTVEVAGITANVLPGVRRALETARCLQVRGTDLSGATQQLSVKVCEAGPFLAMKLRAFVRRQQPKDAFDILYTLRHYDLGTGAAVASFVEEVKAKNPACPDAVRCLESAFGSEKSSAPVKAAHFVLGQAMPDEDASLRTRRLQIQQDMVDAGRLLRAALPALPP